MESAMVVILVRLLDIARTIPGIVAAFRNTDEISEKQRPCILILDADEAVDQGYPYGMDRRPTRVGLTPECYVMLGAKPEQIGTDLNHFRAAILKSC